MELEYRDIKPPKIGPKGVEFADFSPILDFGLPTPPRPGAQVHLCSGVTNVLQKVN